jgi:hypothetical protein
MKLILTIYETVIFAMVQFRLRKLRSPAHQPDTQSKRLDFMKKSGRVGGSGSVFAGPTDFTLCTDYDAFNEKCGISHIGHP